MKKRLKGIVFLGAVISFSFCQPLSAEVVDRIVAIVNSDIVTLVQLKKETQPYMKNIESSGYSVEKKKTLMHEVNKNMLNAMVDRLLTQQEAARYHINVSDNEINNAVEKMKKRRSLSQEEFEQALNKEELTVKEYRDNIKKQILQTKLINHAVKSKVVITESDIKKEYKKNAEKFSGQKKYHLRNILMKNRDDIKEIKNKLDKKNKFTVLAKKYSMASNASDGGDLGFFDIENFSEKIKTSISKLSIGDYTDVISTAQGFQIFFIQDIVMEGGKTLKQAHDQIQESLYRREVEKKFKTWLESLKKKAHIKIML